MANEFIIKNGYFSQGSSNITGSLTVTGGITGSLFGTASWAQNATSASFLTSNTNAFIQGGNSFGTTALLGTNDTQNLNFETNGSVRMTVSSSGQVVYGSNPLLILSGGLFQGVSPFMEVQTGITGGAYNEAMVLRHNGISVAAVTRSLGLLIKLSSENMPNEAIKMGGMILRSTSAYANSSDLHFVIGNTETMTISNAGNVGIGTTTPTQKLTVAGGSIVLDNSTALKHKNTSGTELDMVTLNAGNSLYLGSGQRDIYLRAGNNNIVYVTSSAVGIGTTTPNARLDVNGNAIITGSLIVTNDLTILGSASIQYITSSQLNIFDNIISVNTFTPSVRFGGIAVNDSGSTPIRSGSLLFDSQNNQWIFVHQNTAGGATTSSMLLMGPQTFNNLGNETGLTTNRLPKGAGVDLGEHLTDSNIEDNGTEVSINSNTAITGSLKVIGDTYITGGLQTYFDDTGENPGLYLPVLDTVNNQIYTNSGLSFNRLSISYGVTRSLYDGQVTQQKSVDWANRNLVNLSGSTVLDWNTGIDITGSTQITGSLGVTGSVNVTAGITGSLFGTASWARNATTSSFINVTNTNNASDYYIVGIDSDNGAQNPEQLYNFGTLAFNPDANTLKVANGAGTIIGTASYAPNFANTDLTFTGDRTHDIGSNSLFLSTTSDGALSMNSSGVSLAGSGYSLVSVGSFIGSVLIKNAYSGIILDQNDSLSISALASTSASIKVYSPKIKIDSNVNISGSLGVTGSLIISGSPTALRVIGDNIVTGSLAISGSVIGQSGNTISSNALLQATLLYLSNNF